MNDLPRPTVRSRHLGMRLRTLREERDLTLRQAARLLNRSPSSLSRLETGTRGIRRPSLENMLDRYGVADPETRESLFTLARNARQRGWWQKYEGTLSQSDLDYISLEAVAAEIGDFQLHLVSGLLQTEDYARSVIRLGNSLGDPDVNGLTEIRMRRQRILASSDPPHFWAILSEGALRQQMGGRAIMRAQLRRLMEVSEVANVTLQVLPFTAGAHPGQNGSFTTLSTEELSVVLVENLTTGWYLEDAMDVRRYELVFERLRAKALSSADSRMLMRRILSET